jgi:hypothetical protein
MKINEIAPKKPLTPQQARIKSLRDQVKRSQAAVKIEKARQKISSGQMQMVKAKDETSNVNKKLS